MNLELVIFLVYILIREVMHHAQINKLQELLKTTDLKDYYRAKKGKVNKNNIKENKPNKISFDDPDFDLKKLNKVIVDGEEKPVQIF